MKLVMTLLCREEADILEAHLRFHLELGVDHIIAMNNLSTDATVSILRDYERAGVLTLIQQDEDIFDQDRWVTAMARAAATVDHADWVINSDADEFWWPLQGNLKDVLEALPAAVEMVQVQRHNFIPVATDAGHFYDRMRIREAVSRNSLGDLLPPKACHRAFPDIDVAFGNHSAKRGHTALREIDGSRLIEILHFPLRTYDQLERKIRVGATALNNNMRIDKAVGSTWRRLLEAQIQGQLHDYYQSQCRDPAAVSQGLRSGSLVKDDRLYQFFNHCDRTNRQRATG